VQLSEKLHHSGVKVRGIGDGKIFALTVDQAVRIRTGETDIAAL